MSLARLDRRRVGVEAVVGEQEDVRLEAAPAVSTAKGSEVSIALLGRFLVGDERAGIEGVGLHLLLLEAVGGLHPADRRRRAPPCRRRCGAFFRSSNVSSPTPGCDMSICGSFWNMAATAMVGMFCSTADEGLDHVAAHVEVDACRSAAACGCWPAGRPAGSSRRARIWHRCRRRPPGRSRRARPRRASWCRSVTLSSAWAAASRPRSAAAARDEGCEGGS